MIPNSIDSPELDIIYFILEKDIKEKLKAEKKRSKIDRSTTPLK